MKKETHITIKDENGQVLSKQEYDTAISLFEKFVYAPKKDNIEKYQFLNNLISKEVGQKDDENIIVGIPYKNFAELVIASNYSLYKSSFKSKNLNDLQEYLKSIKTKNSICFVINIKEKTLIKDIAEIMKEENNYFCFSKNTISNFYEVVLFYS